MDLVRENDSRTSHFVSSREAFCVALEVGAPLFSMTVLRVEYLAVPKWLLWILGELKRGAFHG